MGLGFALAGAAALIPAVSAQIRVAKATAAKGYSRLRLSVVGFVERFDRREAETLELFRSEFDQNSGNSV